MSHRVIRILHITTRHNVGGISKVVLNSLSDATFEQFYATGYCEKNEKEYSFKPIRNTYTLYRVKYLKKQISVYHDILSFIDLTYLIWKIRPDIVHTHMSKAGFLGRLASLFVFPRPKLIHSYHGHVLNNYFNKQLSWLFTMIEKRLGGVTNVFQFDGRQIQREISGLHIKPRNFSIVLLPGIIQNTQNFSLGDRKSSKVRILVVSRIETIKGIDKLLEVASIIQYKYNINNFEIIVIGGGSQLKYYKKISKKKNLNIKFLGWKNNVALFYSKSDIFLQLSESEGTPLSVMEAASFGLPILATNVGSLPDLIDDGINGVLTTKNAGEISLKLQELIKDSKKRRRMGRNSIEKSNMEFKVEVFQKKQKSIYRKIIKK
jgi:glycosyltransferase involved in cell wall biosynthesis